MIERYNEDVNDITIRKNHHQIPLSTISTIASSRSSSHVDAMQYSINVYQQRSLCFQWHITDI